MVVLRSVRHRYGCAFAVLVPRYAVILGRCSGKVKGGAVGFVKVVLV